jgi:hypothetical protein
LTALSFSAIGDDGLGLFDCQPDAGGDALGGLNSAPVSSCTGPPLGAVADNTDGDDADASVSPAAAEVAVDYIDNDCDSASFDDPDGDGDGVGICVDCDDGDPTVFPVNMEITCDSLDNDCDPSTADDPHGDGGGVGVCTACDDADPLNYPGNVESCDGIDNNCEGIVDRGVAFRDFCTDADGDGFGEVGSVATNARAAPPGTALDNSDGDDANAASRPGAEEQLGSGVDDDCDGRSDPEDLCRAEDRELAGGCGSYIAAVEGRASVPVSLLPLALGLVIVGRRRSWSGIQRG